MPDRRPTLSDNKPNPGSARRDRRAAERRDRFEEARDMRRARATTRGGRVGGGISTGMITLAALVVGIAIIGILAINQLGSKVTGTYKDPSLNYAVGLLSGDTIGPAQAPVTLEVYEDLQCPVCAQYSLSVEPILVSRYVQTGTLRIVHHDIAILGRGGADDESRLAASGATCANDQGKYWPYIHWVYNNQDGENAGGFRRDRLTAIAEAAGLDGAAFTACIDTPAAIQAVATTSTDAVNLGINSTPTMYIAGQQIVGLKGADVLGAMIEAAAANATASPAASGAPATSDAPSVSATP